jgi:DNA-binding response OmpR family regulator
MGSGLSDGESCEVAHVRVRKKIGDTDPKNKLIVTRRGFAYVYNSPTQNLGLNAA